MIFSVEMSGKERVVNAVTYYGYSRTAEINVVSQLVVGKRRS